MTKTPVGKTVASKEPAAAPAPATQKAPARAVAAKPKPAAAEPAAPRKPAKRASAVKPATAQSKKQAGEAAVPDAVKKPAAKPAGKTGAAKRASKSAISDGERHHLIEVAAYYIAERRGFGAGSVEEDWLTAEREIDAMIASGRFAS